MRLTCRLLMVAGMATTLHACGTKPTSPSSDCDGCRIELFRVATISDSIDRGALPDQMIHAMGDPSRGIFVTARERTKVFAFRSAGESVSVIGRAGDGPGEFRSARRLFVGPGDSLFVSDWGSGRISVFSPDDKFVRTQRLPHFPAFALDDGRFIVADQLDGARQGGRPLLLMGKDGAPVGSFGPEIPTGRPPQRLFERRLAAPARNGGVWAVAPGRYTLERWDAATGALRASIPIRTAWFAETASWPEDERVRPPAVVESLWEDRDGLVWFLIRVADSNWKPRAQPNVERAVDAVEYDQTYDWMVEVVDPRSGAVLASRRSPAALWGRPPSSLLVSARAIEPDETARFDVWSARLVRQDPK